MGAAHARASTESQFREVISVNLVGTFLGMSAATVVFLAGDGSRFSTGSEIMVDGGECAGKEQVRLSELRS